MPRAIWTGAISFGLVSVPVKLYSATESKDVSFHQLEKDSGKRIDHRRFATGTDREVDYDDIVKGYEISKGTYVVVSPDELESGENSNGASPGTNARWCGPPSTPASSSWRTSGSGSAPRSSSRSTSATAAPSCASPTTASARPGLAGPLPGRPPDAAAGRDQHRSEERRVGKEWRARESP